MAGEVLDSALPLAALVLDGLFENARTVRAGSFTLDAHILDADLDDVRHRACLWGVLLTANVGDDDRSIDADPHLRPVVLADSYASTNPNTRLSHATAPRTSGYTSTGIPRPPK